MKVDIYKLGYIYFSVGKDFTKFLNRPIDNFFSKNCFLGLCGFVMKFFHSLHYYAFRFIKTPNNYDGIVLYGLSNNNRFTLKPIINELGSDKVVALTTPKTFAMWRVYWYAFPYLPILIKEFFKASKSQREIIRTFFGKFWRMYGCYQLAEYVIKLYHPKILILANDHLEINRALMETANSHGIKTMYVQHAAITEKFPPLKFSFSLLDGRDSLEKYKRVGALEGSIYLIGGVRFDGINHSINKNNENSRIGVAINEIDDETTIKDLCLHFRRDYNGTKYDVVLRPHPSMNQNRWIEWCENNMIGFSCSKSESSFEYLKNLDLLISNQSSIHLDAAMCHTPSIMFNLAKKPQHDVYDFLGKGLVPNAVSLSDLDDYILNIKSFSFNDDVVRYFNSSFNTKFENNVAKMIAAMCNAVLSKGSNLESFNASYEFKLVEDNYNNKVYSV